MIQFQGRVGRRILTITGPNAIPTREDALALYAAVRSTVFPGKPVTHNGFTVSVRRAVKGPRP